MAGYIEIVIEPRGWRLTLEERFPLRRQSAYSDGTVCLAWRNGMQHYVRRDAMPSRQDHRRKRKPFRIRVAIIEEPAPNAVLITRCYEPGIMPSDLPDEPLGSSPPWCVVDLPMAEEYGAAAEPSSGATAASTRRVGSRV